MYLDLNLDVLLALFVGAMVGWVFGRLRRRK